MLNIVVNLFCSSFLLVKGKKNLTYTICSLFIFNCVMHFFATVYLSLVSFIHINFNTFNVLLLLYFLLSFFLPGEPPFKR
jgi:hypothetical protein